MAKAKQTRMNAPLRTMAIKALLHHALGERAKALYAQERALFDEVYGVIVPQAERELVLKLPKHWHNFTHVIYVNVAGWQLGLHARKIGTLKFNCADLGRYGWRHHYETDCDAVIFPSQLERERHGNFSQDLITRIQKWAQEEKGWSALMSETHRQIFSTISGFATLESMIEVIPELAEIEPRLLEKVEPARALVPNVRGMMCKIASLRGEKRDGCEGLEPLAA